MHVFGNSAYFYFADSDLPIPWGDKTLKAYKLLYCQSASINNTWLILTHRYITDTDAVQSSRAKTCKSNINKFPNQEDVGIKCNCW